MSFILKFILVFVLLVTWAQAQGTEQFFSSEELRSIKKELDLSSYLYQISLDVSSRSAQPIAESAWMRELEETSIKIMKMSYAETAEDAAKVDKFRNFFKWKKWWLQVKNLSPKLKGYSRLNGMGIAFALVATLPSEFVGPIIVTSLGHPQLAGIAAAFPATTIAVGGQIAVQRYFIKQELIKTFGSKEAYQVFVDARKEQAQLMSLNKIDDYIHKISSLGSEIEVVVIQKESLVRKFMDRTGIKKLGITFSDVEAFCERRNLHQDDFLVKSLLENTDLPKEHRAGLILEHLKSRGEAELVSDIYDWFGDGIKKIEVTRELEDVYKLATKLSRASNIDELKAIIQQAPEGIDAKAFMDVWRNRSLEQLSQHLATTHFQYRRLVKNVTAIYGEVQAMEGLVLLDKEMKHKFLDYLEFAQSKRHLCDDLSGPL